MGYILLISGGYIISLCSLYVFYKKLNPSWLQFFIWFIGFEYLTQVAAIICLSYYKTSSNGIANLHTAIAHIFYLFIYYLALEKKSQRKLPLIFIMIFLLIFLYEILFVRSFLSYANIADSTGRFFILVCCLIYLFQLLTKNEVVNYFRVPMFWITIGILTCITGDWIYVLFYYYLLGNSVDNNGAVNYVILIITNNIQYILFTIGFTCNIAWRKRKLYLL
jgi:hypothetical protein